jgi:hypothetical protein
VLQSENRTLGPRGSRHGPATAGCLSGARKAYEWLADRPLSDGSWYSTNLGGKVEDRTRDTNMTTYIAVGVYHYFLLTANRGAASAASPIFST